MQTAVYRQRAAVLQAVADVVASATEVQGAIANEMPPEWVACYGPMVTDVKAGMIFVHQAWNELIEAVRARRNPVVVAALMTRLSGVAMKISMDVAAIGVYEPKMPAEPAGAKALAATNSDKLLAAAAVTDADGEAADPEFEGDGD